MSISYDEFSIESAPSGTYSKVVRLLSTFRNTKGTEWKYFRPVFEVMGLEEADRRKILDIPGVASLSAPIPESIAGEAEPAEAEPVKPEPSQAKVTVSHKRKVPVWFVTVIFADGTQAGIRVFADVAPNPRIFGQKFKAKMCMITSAENPELNLEWRDETSA